MTSPWIINVKMHFKKLKKLCLLYPAAKYYAICWRNTITIFTQMVMLHSTYYYYSDYNVQSYYDGKED